MVRFKNRWLLVEFLHVGVDIPATNTLSNITSRQVYLAVKDSVISNFGDAGWGAVGASLTVKYFSPTTSLCIVRVGREHVRVAWGAITLLTRVEGSPVLPQVMHCSGTIKHVQLAAISHNREIVALFKAKAQGHSTESNQETGTKVNHFENSSIEIAALQD